LEASLKSGDSEEVNTAFDYEAFVNRIMFGIEVDDPRVRQMTARNIREAYTGTKGIGLELAKGVAGGTHCRLLRVHRQGNEQRALFRMSNGADKEYLDFVVLRDTSGKPKIGDYFSYLDGSLFSEEVHQNSLCDAAQMDSRIIPTLSPAEHEYFASRFEFRKMRELGGANQFKEACGVYKKFSDALQHNPYVLHEYLVARCALGAECDDTIRAYRAARPNDPGLDLHLLGYYVVSRRFDDALASVERLDKAVGGDPYLDADRATIYAMKGNRSAAEKSAQKAVAADPDDPFLRKVLQTVTLPEHGDAAKRHP
jgi:tetratricopeptide (TPR) repeat protein